MFPVTSLPSELLLEVFQHLPIPHVAAFLSTTPGPALHHLFRRVVVLPCNHPADPSSPVVLTHEVFWALHESPSADTISRALAKYFETEEECRRVVGPCCVPLVRFGDVFMATHTQGELDRAHNKAHRVARLHLAVRGFSPQCLMVDNLASVHMCELEVVLALPPVSRIDMARVGVPEDLVIPSTVRTLALLSSGIHELAGPFPAGLRVLSLGGNRLNRILSLGQLPESLEELHLGYNDIASLKGFVFPPFLTTLVLAGNCLHTLADAEFPNTVEELVVALNRLESVGGIRWPRALKRLDLGNNILTSVSDLRLPAGVEQVLLSHNAIGKFLVELPPSTTRLLLDHNLLQCSSVDWAVIARLGNLITLDLLLNRLCGMDWGSVCLPHSVEGLLLGHCGLESLEGILLPAALVVLGIEFNSLSSVHQLHLPGCTREVRLTGNCIEDLDRWEIPLLLQRVHMPNVRVIDPSTFKLLPRLIEVMY